MSFNSTFSASRRRFVTGLAASTAFALMHDDGVVVAQHRHDDKHQHGSLAGHEFDLDLAYMPVNFTGKTKQATSINGSIPGPTLRWREGDIVSLNVRNHLSEDSSLHWHGIILPNKMDGVPGLGSTAIKPGESTQYRFKVQQSGTYWYHSHAGFQEQTGLYGAIVIEPKQPLPYHYDREHIILLSDWSDESPERIFANLKKAPDLYNINERTLADLSKEVGAEGFTGALRGRSMWNNMRMSDRDISDVTGKTYTFLMNGRTPAANWTGEFKRGEKILLRFINASAMTFFDIRIPDLKMTVVASDGQAIQPVTVDEFRLGAAETYDVIVEPSSESAYSLFCQAIDRSGYAHGTLTPNVELSPTIPEMDESPILSHVDMGMNMGMAHSSSMAHAQMQHTQTSSMQTPSQATSEMSGCSPQHAAMGHCKINTERQEFSSGAQIAHSSYRADSFGTGLAGYGSDKPISYANVKRGPQVDMLARGAQYRLDDPGVGLRNNGRRVLTYADLYNVTPTLDPREPGREIELHLTGNMSRYMWSMNGIGYANAEPILLKLGERIRFTLVNNTMMHHPIHLHGMWSDLETGDANYIPRKHTIVVQPGAKISYLVTVDAPGRWAYHCHLLYHMAGMFREVRVV